MMKELFEIQQKLKSNKDKFNDFAKYAYRTLEDILSDMKPLLKEYGCTITFNDEIVNVGAYNYIKSTAILTNSEGKTWHSVGWAREDNDRAGMSAGQLTGCGSSYSRKYALCGMCAICEEKDLDALDNRAKQKSPPSVATNIPTEKALQPFCAAMKLVEGIDTNELVRFYKYYSSPSKKNPQLTIEQSFDNFNAPLLWKRWIDKQKEKVEKVNKAA
jgi:hypothetical protein